MGWACHSAVCSHTLRANSERKGDVRLSPTLTATIALRAPAVYSAQYLGGRLSLRPLEGYGTDCFLHLSRLGAACETLPATVTLSPAERESTVNAVPSSYYSLAKLSEYEHALLSARLAEIRHGADSS